jgi:tRNA(His) guanylyltransferase
MNSQKISIGTRMKEFYEYRMNSFLVRRIPVIIRLDGKAFHTLTRKYFKKPHDQEFSIIMRNTAFKLCNEIQGTRCAYIQSDEISILVTDFDNINSDCWFDYNIQKITSITAAIASVNFSFEMNKLFYNDEEDNLMPAYFDSRVFNIPTEEIKNYFIWRQKDCERNSLNGVARMFYSHKELENKKKKDVHEMLFQKGVNWANLPDWVKNGVFVERQKVEGGFKILEECPIFMEKENFFMSL